MIPMGSTLLGANTMVRASGWVGSQRTKATVNCWFAKKYAWISQSVAMQVVVKQIDGCLDEWMDRKVHR